MFRATVFLYLVVSMIAPAGVSAQTSDDSQVAVSVFNDAHVDRPTLESGLDRAAAVFRRSGIQLIWAECSQGLGKISRDCTVPSDGAHLALRILTRSLNLKSEVYGVAFLGEDGRGTQADVFFGEVANHAPTGANVSNMLGHVIAHELGHLLLGSNSHATSGIMRSRWQAAELQSLAHGALFFTPDQVKLMQARLQKGEKYVEARLGR